MKKFKRGEITQQEALQELGQQMTDALEEGRPVSGIQKEIDEVLGMDSELTKTKEQRDAERAFERKKR